MEGQRNRNGDPNAGTYLNAYTHGDGYRCTHAIANGYRYPFSHGHDRTNGNAFRFKSRFTHTVTHSTKPYTYSNAAKPNSDVHPPLADAYSNSHGYAFAIESGVTISNSHTAKPNPDRYRHAPTNALPDRNAGCDTYSDTVTSTAAKHIHSSARRNRE